MGQVVLAFLMLVVGVALSEQFFQHPQTVDGSKPSAWTRWYRPESLVKFFKSIREAVTSPFIRTESISSVPTLPVLTSSVSSSVKSAFDWENYYDIDEIYEYLRSVAEAHPDEAELIVGGTSYEGRDILGLRIHSGEANSTKKVIMLESGIHAREWICPASTTYFIDQLFNSSNSSITDLKSIVDWHIFPSVNPDGYHFSYTTDRMWRKTRSLSANGCYGVDGNRNFDYNWNTSSTSPSPCDYNYYAGTKPFSEVEYQTLSEYITSISDNLVGYVGLHAYEQSVYVPYSDSTEHIWNYDDMVDVGKTIIEYAKTVNGSDYAGPATAAELSYPASGLSPDWVYYKFNISMSFTIEMRGFQFQWPPSTISIEGDELTQMMLGMVTAAKSKGYV